MAFINETIDTGFYVSTWKTNKSIPDSLKQLSCEDFELVLSLACKSLESLRNTTNTLKFTADTDRKIIQLQDEHAEEISNKDNNIRRLETVKRELQESYNILHKNFINLQTTMNESVRANMLETNSKQNTFLSSQIASIQQTFNSQITIYREQIDNLNESLKRYQSNALIDQNSSNKGKQGELSFDELAKLYVTWVLKDTSKITEACDRQSIIRGCKTLFEIKNYKSRIPSSEVEKFRRNMETHKDAPLGVFISLNTQITGGSQELLYSEITSNNQLLIFIQKFNSFEPENIFAYLNNFIDIALLLYTKTQQVANDIDLQSKVDSIKPILLSSLTQISQMTTELNTNKRFLIDTMNTHHVNMKSHIDRFKLHFESFINLFFLAETTNSRI